MTLLFIFYGMLVVGGLCTLFFYAGAISYAFFDDYQRRKDAAEKRGDTQPVKWIDLR